MKNWNLEHIIGTRTALKQVYFDYKITLFHADITFLKHHIHGHKINFKLVVNTMLQRVTSKDAYVCAANRPRIAAALCTARCMAQWHHCTWRNGEENKYPADFLAESEDFGLFCLRLEKR